MSRARVLLAEDSPVVARQLRTLLGQDFDVLVTDISMPGMDGLRAAELVLRQYPELRVVFITVHSDADLIARARALTRTAYVLKADAGDDLVAAVDAVMAGRWFLSASLAKAPAGRGQQ